MTLTSANVNTVFYVVRATTQFKLRNLLFAVWLSVKNRMAADQLSGDSIKICRVWGWFRRSGPY